MSDIEAYDSDAPEEFTAKQGIQQHQEINELQKENNQRVAREGKKRRRLRAQSKTEKPAEKFKSVKGVANIEESRRSKGMLPNEIVQLLAARDKQVFLSDSEDDDNIEAKNVSKTKRKPRSSGVDTVVVSEIPAAECLESSLEFLKKRKMQVARSSAVLKNSNQALRLLSSSVLLK